MVFWSSAAGSSFTGFALSAEEVSGQLGQPLFRVRSSLREMVEAGLVVVQGDKYEVSEAGKKKAAAS